MHEDLRRSTFRKYTSLSSSSIIQQLEDIYDQLGLQEANPSTFIRQFAKLKSEFETIQFDSNVSQERTNKKIISLLQKVEDKMLSCIEKQVNLNIEKLEKRYKSIRSTTKRENQEEAEDNSESPLAAPLPSSDFQVQGPDTTAALIQSLHKDIISQITKMQKEHNQSINELKGEI